jgi:hypothetical protein
MAFFLGVALRLRVPFPERVLPCPPVPLRIVHVWSVFIVVIFSRHFQTSLLVTGFGCVVMEHHHSLYTLMFLDPRSHHPAGILLGGLHDVCTVAWGRTVLPGRS